MILLYDTLLVLADNLYIQSDQHTWMCVQCVEQDDFLRQKQDFQNVHIDTADKTGV